MKLNRDYLKRLFAAVKGRDIFFNDQGPGVLLRHDVDNDLLRSMRMAELQQECGVKATYFILNTAPYWQPGNEIFWANLRVMQGMGHEIAWHNNALTEWVKKTTSIESIVERPLKLLRDNGLAVRGSASHGDKLCYVHGYINYEVFEECRRTQEARNFKAMQLEFPKVKMADFGLEWEAYHVPYDLYYSESGGKWKTEIPLRTLNETAATKRVQILIHPQWWEV